MRRRDDVLPSLREMLVNGVHFGRLSAGDRLPSARKLARTLSADARVIRNAYSRLEADGMVTTRAGARGYFVALGHSSREQSVPRSEWIIGVVSDAIDRGISVKQFMDHARSSLDVVHARTVCLECNDDQLQWLCGELEEDYGFVSRGLDTRTLTRGSEEHAEIERADIIVTTSMHAILARSLGRKLGKPVVLVTLKPEIIAQVTELLANGVVYFLCSDPAFEIKVRELYNGMDNLDNIRTVVVGRDDPASIPEGAPVWVMRRAREKLGGIPPHIRPLNTARIFSSETRSELLAHLVRENLAAASAMRLS